MAFIDNEKVCDSIDSAAVFNAIRQQGVHETYGRILEDICKKATVIIKFHEDTENVQIRIGARVIPYNLKKVRCVYEIFIPRLTRAVREAK